LLLITAIISIGREMKTCEAEYSDNTQGTNHPVHSLITRVEVNRCIGGE